MPYLQTIIDYYEDEGFSIRENDTGETLYERLEKSWKPNNRFPIWKILGNDLPDFIIWLQEQIDDEREDTTETITFPPERTKEDETRQEEILDTEIKLLQARKELAELELDDLRSQNLGSLFFESLERSGNRIIEGAKRFIRNIFGG